MLIKTLSLPSSHSCIKASYQGKCKVIFYDRRWVFLYVQVICVYLSIIARVFIRKLPIPERYKHFSLTSAWIITDYLFSDLFLNGKIPSVLAAQTWASWGNFRDHLICALTWLLLSCPFTLEKSISSCLFTPDISSDSVHARYFSNTCNCD